MHDGAWKSTRLVPTNLSRPRRPPQVRGDVHQIIRWQPQGTSSVCIKAGELAKKSEGENTVWSWLGWVLGAIAAVVLVAAVSYWVWPLIRRRNVTVVDQPPAPAPACIRRVGDTIAIQRYRQYTAKEIEEATCGFSKQKRIASGGQGTVFEAIIDELPVAIKKCEIGVDNAAEFANEVKALSRLNHPNIVKVFGFCDELESACIVYDYISEGTLYDNLFKVTNSVCLDWTKRMSLAIQIARGIEYMHKSCGVLHRDLKSQNILLDANFNAILCDFGLARVVDDKTHVTTAVKGSFPYIAPEVLNGGYHKHGRFVQQYGREGDIFSLGVVLSKIATGKKPRNPDIPGVYVDYLYEFVCGLEEGNLEDWIDKKKLKHRNKRQMVAVLALTKKCLDKEKDTRPTISEVVGELEAILQME